MKPLFILILLALAGLALVVGAWAFHLRRALRQSREENQRLRQVLLLGSHSAQQELDTLRQLRHDLRHYLLMADTPAPPEGTPEPPPQAGDGGSWALNTLEQYYRGKGKELGFETDIHLNVSLSQDALLPDLCLLLSNLLENAVEALQREGGGWLRARRRSTSGYVSLVVGNSCSTPLRTRNGRYLSSKKEGRVGVGLTTIQEIARRYGGAWEFEADGTQFRAYVFLPCPTGQEGSAPLSVPAEAGHPVADCASS